MTAETSPWTGMLALTTTGYIALAWVVTFGVVALYAAWILHRGRELSRRVPEDERRWM